MKGLSGTRWIVLGARGFIGARLVALLRSRGAGSVEACPGFACPPDPGAHIVDCVGVTHDFRARPIETMEAHIVPLFRLLREGVFRSLLYLSSTRLYTGTGSEDAILRVDPGDASQLYNISKIAGEALCRGDSRPCVRVARLSNLYGGGMGGGGVMGALLDSLRKGCEPEIAESPDSSRDYLAIDDALEGMITLAMLDAACDGAARLVARARICNIAAGRRTSHRALAALFERLTGRPVRFAASGPRRVPPRIATGRISAIFREGGHVWRPRSMEAGLREIITSMGALRYGETAHE